MAEIYFHVQFLLQSFVLKEEDVVVERDRRDLRKPLLHAQERAFDVAHRYREDPFEQRLAYSAVDENEEKSFSAFPGDDEVALHVTESLSLVDTLGSFGDHALPVERSPRDFPAMSASEYLRAMRLDSPAVHALDVPLDRGGRDVRDTFLDAPEPACNRVW